MGASKLYVSRRLNQTWRLWLDVVASTAMITASAAMIWFVAFAQKAQVPSPTREVPIPEDPIPILGDYVGSVGAPLALILFSDYQCSFCARFSTDVFPILEARYIKPGKVLYNPRHLPLRTIHPFAWRAAESAVCAGRQSRFLEMHDSLFNPADSLNDSGLMKRAQAIGLDTERFASCLSGEATAAVEADDQLARRLSVSTTPTLLLGRLGNDRRATVLKIIHGSKTMDELASAIDELLQSR